MQSLNFTLKAALVATSLTFASSAFAVDITGAGATFPYPIYWVLRAKKSVYKVLDYQGTF